MEKMRRRIRSRGIKGRRGKKRDDETGQRRRLHNGG